MARLRQKPDRTRYLGPAELQDRTCEALLQLMSGLLLTLVGLLLGLFSSSVAMASASDRVSVSALAWLILIGLLLIALAGILLRSPGKSDPTGQPHRQNGSTNTAPPAAELDSDIPSLDKDGLAALLCQHMKQCTTESRPMAVIAVKLDRNEAVDATTLTRSLRGLARSRGARLVQSLSLGVIVLAPGQTLDQAERLAEALHQSIISLALPNEDNALGIVTADIGLVVAQPESQATPKILLARLAKALDKAAQAGGNRVEAIHC